MCREFRGCGYMDDRFLQAGIKEIPVFDISVYINRINFRYIKEIHYYCNIFCKIRSIL
jgi:hypothetical protein